MRERDRPGRTRAGHAERLEIDKLEVARVLPGIEHRARLLVAAGASEAWASVGPLLRDRFGESNFLRWIEPLAVGIDSRGLSIEAPDRIGATAVRQHFLPGIVAALREVGWAGGVCLDEAGKAPHEAVAAPAGEPARGEPNGSPSSAAAAPEAARANADGDTAAHFPLNARYTFERFAVGESNGFAHMAASLVADLPGRVHNPLYMHGGVGRGKTHLATATAHRVRDRAGAAAAISVSADRFLDRCSAVARGEPDRLDRALQGAELAIFDDVQLLARDERVLDELFWLFDALLAAGRQLVLVFDLPPAAIPSFARRLEGRRGSGLAVEIQAPDPALRREIVRRQAALAGCPVDDEVVEFIAAAESDSIRALEGAFHRARELAAVTSRVLSLVVARQALAAAGRLADPGPPSLDQVAEAVAVEFDMTARTLRGRRRRDRDASLARQVAVHLARRLCGCGLAEIAVDLGFREHSAAAHAAAAARERLASDPDLAMRVARIEQRLARRRTAPGSRRLTARDV